VLLSGTGGALLTRWLSRSKGDVVLISIAREAPAQRRARITPRLNELSQRFTWSMTFSEDDPLTYGDLRTIREQLAKLANESLPEAMAEARRLREEIPRTSSKAGKTQIAFDLVTPRKLLREQIIGGLLRQDLTIALSDADAERVVDVADAEKDGAPAKVFSFPTATVRVSFAEYFAPAAEMAKVLPLIEAVSRFDEGALLACVEYAERTFQTDADQAHPIIAEMDEILKRASWGTEAVLVNRGDRALVIHAYGVLITRGTQRNIPPLPLRITEVLADEAATAPDAAPSSTPQSSAYLSVPPQTTVRLRFESDADDAQDSPAALEAVFDTDLLDCALVLLRQGRAFPSRKRMQSGWVRFGKGLEVDQSRLVLEAAKRSSRGRKG
jgi:hypothetical protein